jgi:hypothetical protein
VNNDSHAGMNIKTRTLIRNDPSLTPFESPFGTQGKQGEPFDSSRASPFETPFGTQGKQGKPFEAQGKGVRHPQ